MQITVVGLGYVGLVTATCLARLGQDVTGLESDKARLRALERGEPPFFEPGLEGDLTVQRNEGRLKITSDARTALRTPSIVLICVGTPSGRTGEADLTAVDAVMDTVADVLEEPCVIALRSTVPVGTTRRAEHRLNSRLNTRGGPGSIPVFANPEFLRTGRALDDFLRPSRVVLGRTELPTEEQIEQLVTLYRPLDAPIFILDAESAEIVKTAANSYLAMRISFINELAALCDASSASIDEVITGIASDPRIGGDYLHPGLGYGGSCLPKDVRSLIAMGTQHGVPMRLAHAVDSVNQGQPDRLAQRLAQELGGSLRDRCVGLLGLAFKPGTDDTRDSPALAMARALREMGAVVVACDPQAGARVAESEPWITIMPGPMEVAAVADGLVLATEWPEYVTIDLAALAGVIRRPLILDARNALDGRRATAAGWRYLGVGRESLLTPS